MKSYVRHYLPAAIVLATLLLMAPSPAMSQTEPTMVKDINPGANYSDPKYLTNMKGTLFFVANDGVNGEELWKSDGTKAGTMMVRDINLGPGSSEPEYLTTESYYGSLLFFVADDGTRGRELWKSDGTEPGTVIVKDMNPGPGSSQIDSLVQWGGTLFFRAWGLFTGWELWKTDGTEAGTVMVKDVNLGGNDGVYFSSLTRAQYKTIWFVGNDGAHGWELWKSDGTDAGTVMVKDINPGSSSSFPSSEMTSGALTYFAADDGTHGRELWGSYGTQDNTSMIKDIKPGPLSSNPGCLTYYPHEPLFFTADDGTHGIEVWKSDSTDAGTVMVKDIWPGSGSSSPARLTYVQLSGRSGALFFGAWDGTTTGYELWKSDGTEAGTVIVKDINPGSGNSSPNYLTMVYRVRGMLFFQAFDGSIGEGVHGWELWKSDGTEEGTVLVKDINPGGGNGVCLDTMTSFRRTLYLCANDFTHGKELWKCEVPLYSSSWLWLLLE